MPELFAKLGLVERCQPRLAKAGRKHHERPTVTASTNLAQTGERLNSHLMWCWRCHELLGLDAFGRQPRCTRRE
jgi:hypothetical protein